MRSLLLLAALLGSAALLPSLGSAHAPTDTLTGRPHASAVRLVSGGIAGGALGIVAGAVTGFMIGGNSCAVAGNPDSCRGMEGAAFGMLAGHSVGVPLGAHLANRRRGKMFPGLLLNAGLATAGGLLVHQAERGTLPGDGASPSLILSVAAGVPLAQLVGSVILERRTSR